jgi:hypothetical protein
VLYWMFITASSVDRDLGMEKKREILKATRPRIESILQGDSYTLHPHPQSAGQHTFTW